LPTHSCTLVVVTALPHDELPAIEGVNQAVFLRDPPRLRRAVEILEVLGLAQSGCVVTTSFFDQHVYSLKDRFVVRDPMLVVVPAVVGEGEDERCARSSSVSTRSRGVARPSWNCCADAARRAAFTGKRRRCAVSRSELYSREETRKAQPLVDVILISSQSRFTSSMRRYKSLRAAIAVLAMIDSRDVSYAVRCC